MKNKFTNTKLAISYISSISSNVMESQKAFSVTSAGKQNQDKLFDCNFLKNVNTMLLSLVRRYKEKILIEPHLKFLSRNLVTSEK